MTHDPAVLDAFTEGQVLKLTKLSARRLAYWRQTGFYRPSAPQAAYGRYYSFRDVVALRTLRALRDEHRIPLQHLRQVAAALPDLGQDIWHRCTIYVHGRAVALLQPGEAYPWEPVARQYVMSIPLQRIADETRRDARKLMSRPKSQVGKVQRARGSEAMLAGTRIPVSAVQRFAEAGFSPEQIVAEYPDLTLRDVRAALAHSRTRKAA